MIMQAIHFLCVPFLLGKINCQIILRCLPFYQKTEWVELSKSLFDPLSLTKQCTINDETIKRADSLYKSLSNRLTRHIRRRISDQKKREHWCLQWESKNFAPMAALMILFGHIKEEIDCLGDNSTLLKSAEYFIPAENEQSKLQGAYLHFDKNDEKWIRSGKVTGRGFDMRNKEHMKCANEKYPTQSFYVRYPAKSSICATSSGKIGFLDNLCQYIALGFEVGNDYVGEKIAQVIDKGGIFLFSESEKKKIDDSKKAGRNTTMLKRIDMIAYLIELAYDLAISPIDNLLESQGFESSFIFLERSKLTNLQWQNTFGLSRRSL